jgi:type I restriction enzyme, S subunit
LSFKNPHIKIIDKINACFQNGIYKPAEDYIDEGTKIVRINDYSNDGVKNFENLKRVKLTVTEIDLFSLRENDVLINRVNSISHIGKSCFIDKIEGSIVFESNMMRLRLPKESEISPKYIFVVLNSSRARDYFRKVAKPAVAQASINQEDIKSLAVFLPSKEQQIAIADLLSTWDTAIEKTERLIVVRENRYSHLVSRMISDDRHHRRHIRDFTKEVSKRNSGAAIDRVLSVTNNNGFVLPEDQFKRRVASSDLSNYKVITIGQYAYNPSRINVGSIARLDGWDRGVLSPMYVVFEIDEKKVNSDFFLHWLSSHEAKERIRKSAQGSVRETVSFTDLGAIAFPLPSHGQQEEITKTLNTARQEIDLLRRQVDAFRKQKRGLMQKLLTGQWRVKKTGS